MPKKLDIEPTLTTLAPPSMALATSSALQAVAMRKAREEVDGHDLLEDLGVVLAATAGQVLAGVVDEHVEAGRGAAATAADGLGVGQPARAVVEAAQIVVVVAGRGPGAGDGDLGPGGREGAWPRRGRCRWSRR